MRSIHENPQLALAHKYLETTGDNIFLTGKAGTGKTTFLRNLQISSPKRMVVVAPTGVAAINAGGVTIHSFFQLPFGPHLPKGGGMPMSSDNAESGERGGFVRMSREKKNIIRSLDLLVIDEISMVRADLLDGIDEVLCRYRRSTLPFGGVQLLMIGDLQQLAPILKPDERALLQKYYDNFFFFGSRALQEVGFTSIELKHIYRQSDEKFIDVLNKIRENRLDDSAKELLHQRYIPGFTPGDDEGYITLTTHNAQANSINEKKLQELESKVFQSVASVQGDFPEYMYPTEFELTLKEGAQVMFVKNDPSPEKLFYNGKIGRIEHIDEDGVVHVQCEGDESAIEVTFTEWQNMKYSINPDNQEIEETAIGTFKQLPLKLAWAITIHKSQGLTFEHAIIDSEQAFAHGQVYVALSRCRTLEGLVLSSPVDSSGIKTDITVNSFTQDIQDNPPGMEQLEHAQKEFQLRLIKELFDFKGLYRGSNYCLKICRSNAASLLGTPAVAFEKVSDTVSSKLVQVAQKFIVQINTLGAADMLPEENSPLQERIVKACGYFLEQIRNEVLPELESISLESDNKAVKRSLKQAYETLMQEVLMAEACLEVSKSGFRTQAFMETRAKAVIEKAKAKAKKTADKLESTATLDDIAHPDVFTELKSWRHYQAQTDGLPHYMILSQKALISLAQFLPTTTHELKQIKGVGPKTIEKYSDDILQIILAYRDKNNITKKMPEPEKKEKKKKEDTKKLSYTLYQEGKSIAEIAGQRGLALTTIEGHLAHYVGQGELDVYEFISDKKLALIQKYFTKAESFRMNDAKAALGDSVSYSDLRFASSYLQREKKLL